MKTPFLRMGYFLWVIVPVAAYISYQIFGLPHFIWSYSWIDQGQGHDPFAHRYYTSCTYTGPYGEFTRGAQSGECDWFRFFQKKRG